MALLVDSDFFPRLLDAQENGTIATAEDGLALFINESGLNPKAKNWLGCVGLNQMCDGTLQAFFKGDGNAKNYVQLASQFLAIPASQQLDAIEKLWTYRARQVGIANPSALVLYWLNFLPATFVPGYAPSTLLAPSAALTRLGISPVRIISQNFVFADRDDARGVGPVPVMGANGKPQVDANGVTQYHPGKWVIQASGLQRAIDGAKNTALYREALAALNAARQAPPIGPPAPPPDPTPIAPVPDVAPPEGPSTGPSAPPLPLSVATIGGIGLVIAIIAAIAAILGKGR